MIPNNEGPIQESTTMDTGDSDSLLSLLPQLEHNNTMTH